MKSFKVTATFLACALTAPLSPAQEMGAPAEPKMGHPRGGPGMMGYPGGPGVRGGSRNSSRFE
jgi:hypothetical protein